MSAPAQHPFARRERQNLSDDLRPAPLCSSTQWDLALCVDKMAAVALGLLCVVGMTAAAPAKNYDQRQHGELNIHAQLDNIVILLIPSSKINLMDVSPETENNLTQGKPDKHAFLEFLQNHVHGEIDRFDVTPATTAQDENELISQHHDQSHEQEVVATVEEMKPDKDSPEETSVPVKTEEKKETPSKEHSTVSESMQETVFKISIPVELKDAVKKAEDKVKTSDNEDRKEEKESHVVAEKVESVSSAPLKPLIVKDFVVKKKEETQEKKEDATVVKTDSLRVPAESGSALEALIKPVAAKRPETSPESTGTGARREKVIRYKPEAKWAPGVMELLGPARRERQRFGQLCTPGVWDPELKTCIMPGETRR